MAELLWIQPRASPLSRCGRHVPLSMVLNLCGAAWSGYHWPRHSKLYDVFYGTCSNVTLPNSAYWNLKSQVQHVWQKSFRPWGDPSVRKCRRAKRDFALHELLDMGVNDFAVRLTFSPRVGCKYHNYEHSWNGTDDFLWDESGRLHPHGQENRTSRCRWSPSILKGCLPVGRLSQPGTQLYNIDGASRFRCIFHLIRRGPKYSGILKYRN